MTPPSSSSLSLAIARHHLHGVWPQEKKVLSGSSPILLLHIMTAKGICLRAMASLSSRGSHDTADLPVPDPLGVQTLTSGNLFCV